MNRNMINLDYLITMYYQAQFKILTKGTVVNAEDAANYVSNCRRNGIQDFNIANNIAVNANGNFTKLVAL